MGRNDYEEDFDEEDLYALNDFFNDEEFRRSLERSLDDVKNGRFVEYNPKEDRFVRE